MKKFKEYIREQNLQQGENTLDPDFVEAKARKDQRYVDKNIDKEIEDVDKESDSPEHMTEMANNLPRELNMLSIGEPGKKSNDGMDMESILQEFGDKLSQRSIPAYRSGSRGIFSDPKILETNDDIAGFVQKLNQIKNKSAQDFFMKNLMASSNGEMLPDNPFDQETTGY